MTSGHGHLAVWMVLIAMGVIMMIILFLVIIYGKKIARMIMASQREGLVHWTREPAIHVADNSYQDRIEELRGLVLKMASSLEERNKDEEHKRGEDEISNKSLISLH